MFRKAWLVPASLAVLVACGETRRPIGDECLRDEDCLSGVCASRVCASAPPLVATPDEEVPEEQPRIPDGGATPADAAAEGG